MIDPIKNIPQIVASAIETAVDYATQELQSNGVSISRNDIRKGVVNLEKLLMDTQIGVTTDIIAYINERISSYTGPNNPPPTEPDKKDNGSTEEETPPNDSTGTSGETGTSSTGGGGEPGTSKDESRGDKEEETSNN